MAALVLVALLTALTASPATAAPRGAPESAVAATITVVGGLTPASTGPSICKPDCAEDGSLYSASPGSAADAQTNVIPVPPPAGFPPGTPCYLEEVEEQVYETSHWTLVYTFFFSASVCLFSNEIVVYNVNSNVYYPGGVKPPGLTSVAFSAQNVIVRYNANEEDTYSDLDVTYCIVPTTNCQRYRHLLGLSFNRYFVYPFSRFDLLGS
jgi:hypothetical protein